MKILGTGLSGLVGSRITELLSPNFSFENLSLDTGVDITDKKSVDERMEKSDAPWVFHFAAKTDVDGAEQEKSLGEKSPSWIVNVRATEYIVDACRRTDKKLLYISTDFVFDGTRDTYTEQDEPNPQGWYAMTKYEGEKRVMQMTDALIVRIANPYRANIATKPDFVHRILSLLEKKEVIRTPDDQLFVPTFIDDIAWALAKLVSVNASGIYHVVGGEALSPFAAAQRIAKMFGFLDAHIESVPFKEYFAGRAPRPFHAVLENDKISKLGIRMASFEAGLQTVKQQEAHQLP